jgi:hypothetical protein
LLIVVSIIPSQEGQLVQKRKPFLGTHASQRVKRHQKRVWGIWDPMKQTCFGALRSIRLDVRWGVNHARELMQTFLGSQLMTPQPRPPDQDKRNK